MNKAFKKYAKMRYEQTPYKLRAWCNSTKKPIITLPKELEYGWLVGRRAFIAENNLIIENAGVAAKKAAEALIRFSNAARKLKVSNKN